MTRDIKYWLRWLAVLPGAVAAGAVATFPLHWILYATLTNFINPYPELPERALTPFVVAVVYIWAGFRIAPEHKMKTSVTLFGLWMALLGATTLLILTGGSIMGHEIFYRVGGVASAMAFLGASVGLYAVWRHLRETNVR